MATTTCTAAGCSTRTGHVCTPDPARADLAVKLVTRKIVDWLGRECERDAGWISGVVRFEADRIVIARDGGDLEITIDVHL